MFIHRLAVKGLIVGALTVGTISICTPVQAQAVAEARQALAHRQRDCTEFQ